MNTAPECVDMTESLRRGAGRLLYDGDEGSLVLSTDGTFLLSDIQDGALLCEKIRTLCPAAPKLFTVKSDDAAAALMREFSLHDSMRCTQWVYEKGEPPCPVTADIRPLFQVIEWDEHGTLYIVTDWSETYISPMTLARAITPWAEQHQLKIMKLSQMFG